MSTATIETITKMLENLPESQQERVAEHLREYLEDLKDEMRWDESFEKTSDDLSKFAKQAKKEIAEGKAEPMFEEEKLKLDKRLENYKQNPDEGIEWETLKKNLSQK